MTTMPSHEIRPGDVVEFLGERFLITHVTNALSAITDDGTVTIAHAGDDWSIVIDGWLDGRRLSVPINVERVAS